MEKKYIYTTISSTLNEYNDKNKYKVIKSVF
jgi:hypothetical protein